MVNRMKGVEVSLKPKAKLVGANGNIFSLTAIARRALIEAGQEKEAELMLKRVYNSKSYEEALNVLSDYVEIV